MKNRFSNRLVKLDNYVFSQVSELRELSSNLEPIDLSLGNPDDPPDREIIRTLMREAQTSENHRHPLYRGIPELKEKIAEWFFGRFKVKLNPETEILILAGSKQGLGLVGLTFLNKGDVALVPNPAYPVYRRSVLLAEGEPLDMPLLKENRWLPDLDKLSKKVSSKTRIIFINYPNNPTGAVADISFLKKLVDFAVRNDIIIISDMAYSEITFDGLKTHSVLEVDGAKQRTLEFFSFSKSFNMTGWRLGFVVGNKDLINVLQKVRVTVDSGVFHLLQKGGITALSHSKKTKSVCQIYQRRRDVLFEGLKECGWEVEKPEGAIFVWAKNPWRYSSNKTASILKKRTGIIATPGVGLGSQGKRYIRFSLTAPDEKIKQVVKRLKELPIGGKKKMKRMSILLVVGLCLLLFTGCANKPVSPVTTYKFTIDGVVIKDMNLMQDIAYFIVQRDSLPFDSADVIVEGDTLESYGSGEYYLVGPFTTFHPKDTLDITITSESDSVTFTKKIIMPDTFRITDIAPGRLNPGGGSSVIYWTASQYASGYFVIVYNPLAAGYSSLVAYNYTQETIPLSAYRNQAQTEVISGTYDVYVAAYREGFPLYDFYFQLPDGLPTGNINGADGTIGAGVIAPKDSIIVP